MKLKVLILLNLLIILTSCEGDTIFGPKKASELKIVVHNRVDRTMTQTSLFLEESLDNKFNSTNVTLISLKELGSIQPGDSTEVVNVDLKTFSKGNRGRLFIKSTLDNSQQLIGYGRTYKDDFNYVDDSYPGFNTVEFFLVDTSSTKGLQLTFAFSKYSKEDKLLKRGRP